MAVAKTTKPMLNSSGESGHPCLVPDFRGNAFKFSLLRIMFAVGLSYIAFIILRYVPSIPAFFFFCPGYYKQCCDEHWGTRVSFNSGFLSVYAQQWGYWVIRQI